MKPTKDFGKLTQSELADLTDDEINHYIDIRCAEEGIPLMPEKPEGPREDVVIPDTHVFTIEGKWAFTSREEAEAVVSAIDAAKSKVFFRPADRWGENNPGQITLEKGGSYDTYGDVADIKKRCAYSAEQYVQTKNAIERNSAAEKAYKAAKKAYDEAFERRRKYINEVWDAVNDAISEENQRNDYEAKLAEYVELADGDTDKAEVFLYKAYPCAEEYIHPERFDADGERISGEEE